MTFESNKPKRKEKPKRGRRSTRLIILVLLIMIVALTGVHFSAEQNHGIDVPLDLYNPPDGDPFTPLCEFESNPHLYIGTRVGSYFTNLTGEKILPVSRSMPHPTWSANSDYVWGGDSSLQIMVNLETEAITSLSEPKQYNFIYSSPRNGYYLKLTRNENNVNDLIIYDGLTQAAMMKIQTANTDAKWSPSDLFVLLFNRNAPKLAQVIELETGELFNADLPSDVGTVLGWLDDATLLYKTKAGRLRTWDRLTSEDQSYSDIRFDDYYQAGGIQHSPNFSYSLTNKQWIGGIDLLGTLHLFNVKDDRYLTLPIDTSRSFQLTIEDQYVRLQSNTEPREYSFYYPDTDTWADLIAPSDTFIQVSADGKYLFYNHGDNQVHDWVIQEIATGDILTFEEENIQQFEWQKIEGQEYILYSVPVEGGTHVFYLLRPDTKARCKVGTFYTSHIYIQS